jgi:thiamine-phosphate pyrophosphorylase
LTAGPAFGTHGPAVPPPSTPPPAAPGSPPPPTPPGSPPPPAAPGSPPFPPFRLLAISDRRALGDLGFDAWLARLAAARVDGVQLREKDLDDRSLLDLARRARAALPHARLLVNGRLDIALAAGADGVHLPADGLPVAPLRARFGPAVLIGRSTHRLDEVADAHAAGADYVTFGPVFATPSKEAFGPPAGVAALSRAAAAGLPVYALGGVTLELLADVASTGAAGAAGIRLFIASPADLDEIARAARVRFPGRKKP